MPPRLGVYRNFPFARRLKLQQKCRRIAPALLNSEFIRGSVRSATADALGAFGDDLVGLLRTQRARGRAGTPHFGVVYFAQFLGQLRLIVQPGNRLNWLDIYWR
jgi:hypothetical protein